MPPNYELNEPQGCPSPRVAGSEHTCYLVINSWISPEMLWWEWLHGNVSPGLLAHVGFRALLSLDREPPHPQASAVGAALLRLDMCFMMTAVKATRCLQPAQGHWPQLCLVLSSSLESQDVGGGEWLMRGGGEDHAISRRARLLL